MCHQTVGHRYVVRARGTGIAQGCAIEALFSARVSLGRFASRSVPSSVAVAAHDVPRARTRGFYSCATDAARSLTAVHLRCAVRGLIAPGT
jgi:hypothetical protein